MTACDPKQPLNQPTNRQEKYSLNIACATLLLVIGTFSTSVYSTETVTRESSVASLDEYLETLNTQGPDGAELYCETPSGSERHPYDSCESFSALREQGCFGYTTFDIGWELSYAATCAKVEALANAE